MRKATNARRIALLCSEPLRPSMGGIGIRYVSLARALQHHGLEVVLMSPGPQDTLPELPLDPPARRRFTPGRLRALLADCDAALAQGHLANRLLQACPELPTAIDLYDPWLIENLHYAETLGWDVFRNDLASWQLQLGQGDFFLCASEAQRQFYLGFLAALGRINPRAVDADPDLGHLIAVVPTGFPAELPPYRPYLPPQPPGVHRILFGGIYDWYDPWTLLHALEQWDNKDWRLLFMRHPNAENTPQGLFREVEAWCQARGWHEHVAFMDWVPAHRRVDLLREVDVLAAPHRLSLETRLSLRTRFLDAMAAGCPVIATADGGLSRLIASWDAGWVVPPEDPQALRQALSAALRQDDAVAHRRARARELAATFEWAHVLPPLLRFLHAPRIDPAKAASPATTSPPAWRAVVRRLRRWLSGSLAASP